MTNVIFKLLIVLCLISSLLSISVVNNVTVSSDFFQEKFLNEIRFNSNRSGIFEPDDVSGHKCVLELQEIASKFTNKKVLPFIDSWGRLPSGLLYGHMIDYGNYDECVKTTVTLNETLGATTGQYCLASFSLKSSTEEPRSPESPIEERLDLRTLELGVCVPDTCTPEVISKLFQNALKTDSGGFISDIEISECSVGRKPDFEAIDVFAIAVFSSIGLLMVLSTLYDILSSQLKEKPVQLFMAFSVITNGQKLFRINIKKSKNSIDCLTGLRVVSMIWVLYGHFYSSFPMMNLSNSVDILSWSKSLWAMTVLMATVCVDSFLFISGLLVAWVGLQELDKTKGKLNVVMMYVHRYIRLTPPLAAVILFYVSLNKFIGSGPTREYYVDLHYDCKDNWWATLLYIQNYVCVENMCATPAWYLAVDTQLYVLSPLILISLWKWGRKCVLVLIGLSLLSVSCIVATVLVEGYTDLTGFGGRNQSTKIYFPTHTRYPVWLVGIGTGYFMHINKHRNLRPPLVIRITGWILSFGTMLSIVFAPYASMSSSYAASVGVTALYEGFKRVFWGMALAWMVVACHHGFGGIVNSILSHPFWQPFARLTYCIYMVHMAVVTINLGILRNNSHFSDYEIILEIWSTFGICFVAALVLSLSFEAPVKVIEKALVGSGQTKREPNQPNALLTSPSSNAISFQVYTKV